MTRSLKTTLIVSLALACLSLHAVSSRATPSRTLTSGEVWGIFGGKWDNDKCAWWGGACYDGAIDCDLWDGDGFCAEGLDQQTVGQSHTCVTYEEGEYYCAPPSGNNAMHICLQFRTCQLVPGPEGGFCVPLSGWMDSGFMAYNELLSDSCP